VILSTLLGDGLASGKSGLALCMWEGEDFIPVFLQEPGVWEPAGRQLLGGQRVGGFCAMVYSRSLSFWV
jgi:hypothetical protein